MGTNDKITSINVSLPTSQRKFVESDVAKGGFASLSEYFRELIRERQKQRKSAAQPKESIDRRKVREAVRTILDLQQKLSLKGLTVEDLVGEGRDA